MKVITFAVQSIVFAYEQNHDFCHKSTHFVHIQIIENKKTFDLFKKIINRMRCFKNDFRTTTSCSLRYSFAAEKLFGELIFEDGWRNYTQGSY